MNLQTLRYVVTIAQTGSLSKASQYLFVSQSTLSRSVKELEQQLGISLFFRTNQGVQGLMTVRSLSVGQIRY